MNTPVLQEAGLGKRSVLEELFQLIEKHSERFNQDRFQLGDFYDIVSTFDSKFQKFNAEENNGLNISLYNRLLTDTVGNFVALFKITGFSDEPRFYAFKRFIVFFSFLLQEAGRHKNASDIIKNIYDNFPSLRPNIAQTITASADPFELIDLLSRGYDSGLSREFDELYDFLNNFPNEIGVYPEQYGIEEAPELLVYCDNFLAKYIVWQERTNSYKVTRERYFMRMEITVASEEDSASKLFAPLWLITSALEGIKNVSIEIEEIERGSIKAKLLVWMNDLVAKEETKVVLQTAVEGTVKVLTAGEVSYTEVKKSRQETEKIHLENQKLGIEINQMPSDAEAGILKNLDTEKKELENEKLRIENAKAKLEIIDKLSDLAQKGIIKADMIKIDINDILYIVKQGDKITEIGPDIAEIS